MIGSTSSRVLWRSLPVLFALSLSEPAGGQEPLPNDTSFTIGAFEYSRSVDPLTDNVTHRLLTRNIGAEVDGSAQLWWICDPDPTEDQRETTTEFGLRAFLILGHMIAEWMNLPDQARTTGTRAVQYRFDSEDAVGPEPWPYQGATIDLQADRRHISGTQSVLRGRVGGFAARTRESNQLLIRLYDYRDRVVTTLIFNLEGADVAFDHLSCAR